MAHLRKGRNFHFDNYNKVATIKAVRAVSGLGLKEAKDAVEDAVDRSQVVKIEIAKHLESTIIDDCLKAIEANGLVLSHKSQKIDVILMSLQQSAILSAKEEEYELSQYIMDALIKYEELEEKREVERMKRAEQAAIRKFKERERREKEAQFEHNQQLRWKKQSELGF